MECNPEFRLPRQTEIEVIAMVLVDENEDETCIECLPCAGLCFRKPESKPKEIKDGENGPVSEQETVLATGEDANDLRNNASEVMSLPGDSEGKTQQLADSGTIDVDKNDDNKVVHNDSKVVADDGQVVPDDKEIVPVGRVVDVCDDSVVQEERPLLLSKSYSPPAVVYHVDESFKAKVRRAELEELKRMNLAKPQAAKLDKAPAITEVANFFEKQREMNQLQRQNQRNAKEFLHRYRADGELVLRQSNSRRDSDSNEELGVRSSPDATANSAPAYATLDEIHRYFIQQGIQEDNEVIKESLSNYRFQVPLVQSSSLESGSKPRPTTSTLSAPSDENLPPPKRKSELELEPSLSERFSRLQEVLQEAVDTPLPNESLSSGVEYLHHLTATSRCPPYNSIFQSASGGSDTSMQEEKKQETEFPSCSINSRHTSFDNTHSINSNIAMKLNPGVPGEVKENERSIDSTSDNPDEAGEPETLPASSRQSDEGLMGPSSSHGGSEANTLTRVSTDVSTGSGILAARSDNAQSLESASTESNSNNLVAVQSGESTSVRMIYSKLSEELKRNKSLSSEDSQYDPIEQFRLTDTDNSLPGKLLSSHEEDLSKIDRSLADTQSSVNGKVMDDCNASQDIRKTFLDGSTANDRISSMYREKCERKSDVENTEDMEVPSATDTYGAALFAGTSTEGGDSGVANDTDTCTDGKTLERNSDLANAEETGMPPTTDSYRAALFAATSTETGASNDVHIMSDMDMEDHVFVSQEAQSSDDTPASQSHLNAAMHLENASSDKIDSESRDEAAPCTNYPENRISSADSSQNGRGCCQNRLSLDCHTKSLVSVQVSSTLVNCASIRSNPESVEKRKDLSGVLVEPSSSEPSAYSKSGSAPAEFEESDFKESFSQEEASAGTDALASKERCEASSATFFAAVNTDLAIGAHPRIDLFPASSDSCLSLDRRRGEADRNGRVAKSSSMDCTPTAVNSVSEKSGVAITCSSTSSDAARSRQSPIEISDFARKNASDAIAESCVKEPDEVDELVSAIQTANVFQPAEPLEDGVNHIAQGTSHEPPSSATAMDIPVDVAEEGRKADLEEKAPTGLVSPLVAASTIASMDSSNYALVSTSDGSVEVDPDVLNKSASGMSRKCVSSMESVSSPAEGTGTAVEDSLNECRSETFECFQDGHLAAVTSEQVEQGSKSDDVVLVASRGCEYNTSIVSYGSSIEATISGQTNVPSSSTSCSESQSNSRRHENSFEMPENQACVVADYTPDVENSPSEESVSMRMKRSQATTPSETASGLISLRAVMADGITEPIDPCESRTSIVPEHRLIETAVCDPALSTEALAANEQSNMFSEENSANACAGNLKDPGFSREHVAAFPLASEEGTNGVDVLVQELRFSRSNDSIDLASGSNRSDSTPPVLSGSSVGSSSAELNVATRAYMEVSEPPKSIQSLSSDSTEDKRMDNPNNSATTLEPDVSKTTTDANLPLTAFSAMSKARKSCDAENSGHSMSDEELDRLIPDDRSAAVPSSTKISVSPTSGNVTAIDSPSLDEVSANEDHASASKILECSQAVSNRSNSSDQRCALEGDPEGSASVEVSFGEGANQHVSRTKKPLEVYTSLSVIQGPRSYCRSAIPQYSGSSFTPQASRSVKSAIDISHEFSFLNTSGTPATRKFQSKIPTPKMRKVFSRPNPVLNHRPCYPNHCDSSNSTPSVEQELKRVPLYFRRPLEPVRKEKGPICKLKYVPSLHKSLGGCERCLYWASSEEKEKFQNEGYHLRIMKIRGGCDRACSVFPRNDDEYPVRLCRKCYYDTHQELKEPNVEWEREEQ